MADDEPFYDPNRKPAPKPVLQPGELLWTLRRLDETVRAELKDDTAEADGFEVRVWRNGGFLSARRFSSREVAEIEAVTLLVWFQGLRDAGRAAYKAAQVKNRDAMVDVAGTVSDARSACHDVYREKKGGVPDRCLP